MLQFEKQRKYKICLKTGKISLEVSITWCQPPVDCWDKWRSVFTHIWTTTKRRQRRDVMYLKVAKCVGSFVLKLHLHCSRLSHLTPWHQHQEWASSISYLYAPKKTLARMQPRVLLYPTQSVPAAPLTAPNTKQVGRKSSTDFLFMFSPGWDGERRMIGISCKITALWSKIQRSAMCQKAERWQWLSCFWKQLPQSHTATTSVRKYPPTPYPLWMPSLVSASKRAMNVVCHDKRAC